MNRLASPAATGPKLGGDGARVVLRAYTLIELLVVLFLITLLMSVIVPAMVDARHMAKSIVCMDHGRSAAVEFRLFADSYTCGYRGNSEQFGSRFDALDFHESLYKVGEFRENSEVYPPSPTMFCPAAPSGLKRSILVSWDPAVAPRKNVSYAMNRRLYRAPAMKEGAPIEVPVLLTERILNHPYTPLLFDVDAEAAMKEVGQSEFSIPFFCTPDFLLDNYWFPAMRHRGRMIISFVGGHVASTKTPLADYRWDHHPSLD